MTIIENPEPLPEESLAMVTWIFEQIGAVKFLFGDAFYAGAMLAGAGPAVMSIALSGMFDGCVEAGLTQAETIAIGHRMLLGLATPMSRQHHLLQMREAAATCPKGPIIKTLNQIEKHGVRGLLADAMVEGISCFAREPPSGVTCQGPR
jgi:pyrroline-5-carboxylate reductase